MEAVLMHTECLEVSSALLHWSRGQPRLVAMRAELLVTALKLLAERPQSPPLRHVVAKQVAELDAMVHRVSDRASLSSSACVRPRQPIDRLGDDI
jgi:hypothetical protein